MKQEDLEKTQYMRPEEIQRTRQAGTAAPVRPRLEDTQSMPPVDGEIQPPIPQRGSGMGNIRELAPDDAKGQDRYSGDAAKQSWLTPKRKKRLLLGGGFAAALLIGFMIAGYTQDQSAAKQNQRQYEQQQMKEKEQKLVDQERDLKARREQLEQQKKDLQAREAQLEDASGRARGRNEQLGDSAPSSTLGKIIDKVTGKESKRNEQMQQNKQQSAQADTDVASVKDSLSEAQQMLDDVNSKLDSVSSMKQEAGQIKAKAENAYAENKGIVDQAVYYAKVGAGMLQGLLSQ